MATRLAIREQQLATWTAIIQECRNSGMKTKAWLAENNISKDPYYEPVMFCYDKIIHTHT